MGTQDIRSFFGGAAAKKSPKAAAKKPAKRPVEDAIDLSDEDPPAPKGKRAKLDPSPKKQPVAPKKAAAAQPKAGGSGRGRQVTPRQAKRQARRVVESSDSEGGESSDEDYQQDRQAELEGLAAPPAAGRKAEAEDDIVVDLSDESPPASEAESEGAAAPPPKRAKPAKPPAAGKPATPKPAAQAKPKPVSLPRARQAKTQLSESAQAAIAAVDAAAKALPTIEVDLMAEGPGVMGGGELEPPHPGSKPVPRGHPECLAGKTFVITGVLDSLWRGEAEDLIKRHSGRVTSAVSGKTSFLVKGEQAGKSKTAKAKEKKTQVIDEDGLLALVRAAPEPKGAQPPQPSAPQPQPGSGAAAAAARAAAGPAAELNRFPGSGAATAPAAAGSQLWVEKYRPARLEELVGNQGSVKTMLQWLRDWEGVHLRREAPAAQPGRGKPKDLGKKALLLAGPPGIGKTTAALIVTRHLGFEPVEVNASDTRNRADSKVGGGIGGKLANAIKELATNRTIGADLDGRRTTGKKVCLVMDEVDGMSGGDRGGVTELIASIKAARVPIICICNDKYSQKLRSLRGHTLELDFRRPQAPQITERVKELCRLEGLEVTDATLNAVAEGANGDIRAVLGQLQMIRLRAAALSYDEAKGKLGTSKDADMSPFEAGARLLSGQAARMSLGDRIDLVFQDADFVPLLVQENYLHHRPNMAGGQEAARLRVVARAADCFAEGDVVNRRVRQRQAWTLMPFAATVGCVQPAFLAAGYRETFFPGEMNFPKFSAWFGNNSSQGKQRRLLGELHTRVAASGACTADRLALRTDYLPALRRSLVAPLLAREKEGIPQVVAAMQAYCLNKDDLEYLLDVTHWKSPSPWNADAYKQVPAAVKAAFTRALNAAVAQQRPRSNVMVEEFKRRRGKKAAAAAAEEPGDGLAGDPELEAAAAAERAAREAAEGGSPSKAGAGGEEEELDLRDAAALAKKQKQLLKGGISFQSNASPAKGRKPASGGRGSGAKAAGSRGSSGRGSGGRGSGGRGSGGGGSGGGGRGRGRGKA